MKVKIYPRGNPENEAEGIALLIEKVRERGNSERWLVQFIGETRLLERIIRKTEEEPEDPKPLKLFKRVKGSTVRYYYPQGRQPRKPNERLGMERAEHSELKYYYKKQRNKNSKS